MSNVYSFNILAVDANISSYNTNEIRLRFDIFKSTVDELLESIPEKELIEELKKSSTIDAKFCIDEFDLQIEDFFDLLDKSELKHRVAQYLIDNE
jgi:hypothetical protein